MLRVVLPDGMLATTLFFSSRRRHTRFDCDWSSDVCSSDLVVNVTGSYDAFTFTTMLQLEEYGFCKKGEGGQYVGSGVIELGGRRPNNTSGGHLSEGYTHGMSMVIENVRQLRGTVDDYCPKAAEGVHTYDYTPGRCRQVKDAEIAMNLGWAMPPLGSALILRR